MKRIIEDAVYTYLTKNHRGKNNLIKNKELRKLFGIKDDKTMREIIQNIREDETYTEIIGSISGNSGGYYTCTDELEVQKTINNIKHRAKEMLKMCKILENKMEVSK